ncbi:MAG: hypothetical protein H6833_13875 [Planctomycetes bacterium]|nr:hypothetical protein [Planctomycetota bacterium]
MAWVVRLRDDHGDDVDLVFSTSPDFPRIERAARDRGICGEIHIREVTVRSIKPRPLWLAPWMRAR